MKLKNRYLRMSDLANFPERRTKTYTTQSGQRRTLAARPASRGITGFSAKHLYQLINENKFPKPIKLGRASLWRLSDVNRWLESHTSSSDEEKQL